MTVLKKILHNRTVLFGIKALLFILLLELFVFNFRHFQSAGNDPIEDYQVQPASGLILQEDGSYVLGEGDKYLEFTGIDAKLSTMYIDVEIVGSTEEYQPIPLYLSARDTSHENYYWIPDRQIWHAHEKSKYLTYHLYGECKSLKITPALGEGTQIRIFYELNPRIPMFFSFGRVLVLWLLSMFVYVLRPSSGVYKVQFLKMQKGRSISIVSFFLVHMLLVYFLVHINPFFQGESAINQRQYQRLAESLSQGEVAIMEEPAQSLQNMENPYDYDLRNQSVWGVGEDYCWDHAYYEGKYYVYFGVVPSALFYLPYYKLMGEHLHNWQAIFLGAGMFLAGMMGIICQIIRRWFKETSVGVWYLLTELTVLGSGFVYMCKRPDLYTVPIIMGLGFGLLGVWCFLCSEKEGTLNGWQLALGSLLLALVAGCRPQLFLLILFPMLFLVRYWTSLRYLKSGEGIKSVAAVAVPMAVVAALLMIYNYARFGSPFDFGANYNLTFNDMRYRGFNVDRLPLGIWAYLFAPLKWTLMFPFAEANYFSTQYLGVTISEATYGGLFAVNLFVWTGPALLVVGKHVKKGMPYVTAWLCMLIGFVIICVDTEMSGILMRYFNDFQIFFLLAAVLSWLLIDERVKSQSLKKYLRMFLMVCLLVTVVYQCRIFFLDTGEALVDLRKDLFSGLKYQVMFWL